MIKKYALSLSFFLFSILTISLSLAQPPVPHFWYGTAQIDNSTAPDGTIITAHINGTKVSEATVISGLYSIDVFCNSGDNVSFKIFGVLVNEPPQPCDPTCQSYGCELNLTMTTLANGQPCNYNEACSSGYCVHNTCRPSSPYCGDTYCDPGESCSSCPSDCGICPPPPGGGGGFVCTENWTCTDWSACSPEGKQTRTCTDLNRCGTTRNKPAEIQNCTYFAAYCGDGTCQANENCSTCPADCGPCPPPVTVCGNAVCEAGEDYTNCCSDCSCPTGMVCDTTTNACYTPTPPLGITGLVIGVVSNPVYASIIAIVIIVAIAALLRKRYVPIRKR